MNSSDHYKRAEDLLSEGESIVGLISTLAEDRKKYFENEDEYAHLTDRMDEWGKKAFGIWHQAQAHATLARCGRKGQADPVSVPPNTDIDDQ